MIKTERLAFHYGEGGAEVLKNLNIEIKKGGFVAILGHNGSGKTTLAKHFNAINLPTGGKVYVEKMDTSEEALLYDIRQRVGMVFQNPDNQIVATIVEEDVAFAPENLGVPPHEIRRRVDEALAITGMTEYRRHAPHLLSGGQKQRVAIAGVLAMEPAYIVLDEPTAMLDPIGRREVLQTLRRLNRERGMTVVLITHNMDEAAQADRVIVMSGGEVVLDGTPKNVFRNVQLLQKLGLDVPQVTELMHLLREEGLPLPDDVLTVDEAEQALRPLLKNTAADAAPVPAPRRQGGPLLELRHVTYQYSKGGPFQKTALDDVSLTVYKGEFLGIIGHTGSGKSTLVQHFNGLLKPTSGEVAFGGVSLAEKETDLRRLRTKVGLVFQYPEHQLFEETVRQDIAFSPRNMKLSEEEIALRVQRAAQLVGLTPDVMEQSPFALSGGQKRRVAIAGVLAMEPEVLVLDEPTAGLDPRGRRELLQQLKRMHGEYGITVVLVSHGMEDIASYAGRIVVMNRGAVFADGTPAEVYGNYKALEKIGLTAPQVTQLTDRLCGVTACTVAEAAACIRVRSGGGGYA